MKFYRIIMAVCLALLLSSCTFTPKLYVNAGDMTMEVTQGVQPVYKATFSPTRQSVVSGGEDKTVRLWDLTEARMAMTFRGHTGTINQLFYLSDGKTIASKDTDKMLRFWDVTTGEEVGKFASGTGLPSLSQDGRFALDREGFYGGASGGTLNLYDVQKGTVIQNFHGNWGVLSPDGKFVLAAYYELKERQMEGKLDLLESKTGAVIWQTKIQFLTANPDGFNLRAAFTQDGSRIIVAEKNHDDNKESILLIDTATGRVINEFGRSSYDSFGKFIFNGVSALVFSPDGRLIMTGTPNGKYKLWDVSSGQMIREMNMVDLPPGITSIAPSVAFAPDGKTAVVISLGAVRIFDIATGEEIASMIAFEDGEWVAMTPEGYYNASEKGAQYLNVGFEGRDYTVNQFYDVFYRPDIVMAKLSGQDIKGLVSVTMKDASKNPPPTVNIVPPKETNKPVVNICYQVKSNGGGIGEVRLFHNGKLIHSDGYYREVAKLNSAETIQLATLNSRTIYNDIRSISVKGTSDSIPKSSKSKGDVFEECKEVDAVAGDNEVSVSAFNGNNTVQSYMQTIKFKSNVKQKDPHLYILSIGIDEYKDKTVSLKYAVKDAEDLGEKLKLQSATLYKPQNIQYSLLTDREATKANITDKINDLSKIIMPNDSFILIGAGHGALLQNQYYMLTHDYNGQWSESSSMSSNEIVEISKKIKSLSQLFIFDTCHAGGVDYIVSGLYDARMSVLAKKMGLHIYASANDKQAAMDGYKGNGLFTYTLLVGLNNKKEADKNNDGAVSLVELGGFSKQATADISKDIKHSQTPLIINFGKDQQVYKLQNVR